MDGFSLYVRLGFEHILDIAGIDHILFIMTLCAWYQWQEWKKIIILVTAFTIGHSLTLALSALDIFRLDADLVELLIPITIIATGISNIVLVDKKQNQIIYYNYLLALGFGLIHGMGFSNFFRELVGTGSAIVRPLLGFNIGLELGQLLIVGVFFLLYFVLQKWLPFKHQNWTLVISGMGIGASLLIIIDLLV